MHLDVNWLAIVLALVASMALGMVWYKGLAKYWIKATGKSEKELMIGRSSKPFIWAALAQFIMAIFIAQLTTMLFDGNVDVKNTVHTGMLMWFGFILTSMVLNHRYQNMSWKLTLIDGGYLLGVVIAQGIIIGIFV